MESVKVSVLASWSRHHLN